MFKNTVEGLKKDFKRFEKRAGKAVRNTLIIPVLEHENLRGDTASIMDIVNQSRAHSNEAFVTLERMVGTRTARKWTDRSINLYDIRNSVEEMLKNR